MDHDALVHRSLKVLGLNPHGVVSRWKVAVEYQAVLVSDGESRPDQGRTTELDLGTGNDAASLVGDEDAQPTDLLLGRDASLHRNQVKSKE